MDRFGPERKFALGLQKSFESSFTTREIFIKMRGGGGEGRRRGKGRMFAGKGARNSCL